MNVPEKNNDLMFCRQCQETFANVGCTRGGVCGKKPHTARLMDEMIAALEDLAVERKPSHELGRFVSQALFMTLTNTNFDDEWLREVLLSCEYLLGHAATHKVPRAFSEPDPEIRSLKELVLYGLKGIAAYAHHAAVLGKEDEAIYDFLFQALRAMGEPRTVDRMASLALACGRAAVVAMTLLDTAHVSAYGNPEMTTVKLGVGTRPGILVSGHDLRDFAEILEQTKDSGLDIYTHGEMLPAHAYPAFKKYKHLRGNYGGAWHQQQKDFTAFNGAILMTTNCLVPVLDSYRDRIFTTGAAGYPGVLHIDKRRHGRPKDFSLVIERATHCAPPLELEKGTLLIGFAHDQVLALKGRIVEAVKEGKIRKFVVMAGCDGRHPTRAYFTHAAEQLPPDAIILTAGCAKYRYNKLPLGTIDGIPRVLDAGQCNDAYSLVLIALALRDEFGLQNVNDLPLVFDLAWYEQKAVAVVMALVYLGFRNIRLGPTLPAFLSPRVRQVLFDRFGLAGREG